MSAIPVKNIPVTLAISERTTLITIIKAITPRTNKIDDGDCIRLFIRSIKILLS
jgi:hypothetical protein